MNSYNDAQEGLHLLKKAIRELLGANPKGLRNFEIGSRLDIRSDHNRRQKDYLSYSVLGLMIREKTVVKTGASTGWPKLGTNALAGLTSVRITTRLKCRVERISNKQCGILSSRSGDRVLA